MRACKVCCLIGAAILTLSTVGCRTARVTPATDHASVVRMVLDRYLPQDSTREIMTVFASRAPVGVGARIRPNANSSGPHHPPPVYRVDRPSWFFAIDRNSLAKWAHDVTFIFIPTDGSPHVVHNERWWPVIDEKTFWYDHGHMDARPPFVVYEGLIAAAWRDGGRVIP